MLSQMRSSCESPTVNYCGAVFVAALAWFLSLGRCVFSIWPFLKISDKAVYVRINIWIHCALTTDFMLPPAHFQTSVFRFTITTASTNLSRVYRLHCTRRSVKLMLLSQPNVARFFHDFWNELHIRFSVIVDVSIFRPGDLLPVLEALRARKDEIVKCHPSRALTRISRGRSICHF